MTPNEYQKKAYEFAVYKHILYPFFGLAEEAGEVCGVVAKQLRKEGLHFNITSHPKLKDELGDVLWMVAAACAECGLTLEEVMEDNIVKLTARKTMGTIVER